MCPLSHCRQGGRERPLTVRTPELRHSHAQLHSLIGQRQIMYPRQVSGLMDLGPDLPTVWTHCHWPLRQHRQAHLPLPALHLGLHYLKPLQVHRHRPPFLASHLVLSSVPVVLLSQLTQFTTSCMRHSACNSDGREPINFLCTLHSSFVRTVLHSDAR